MEWAAQLEHLGSLGVEPGHIDSHHHVHLLAPLFPAALDLAGTQGLALRVRGRQYAAACKAGVASPRGLVEDYFGYNKTSREWLLSLLDEEPAGTLEVMCHPGRVDDLLRQRSGYQTEREGELAVVGDAGLAAELEALAWQICDFRVLQV